MGIFNAAIFNNAVFNTGLAIKGGGIVDYQDQGDEVRRGLARYAQDLAEVYRRDDEQIIAIIAAFVSGLS